MTPAVSFSVTFCCRRLSLIESFTSASVEPCFLAAARNFFMSLSKYWSTIFLISASMSFAVTTTPSFFACCSNSVRWTR